MRHSHEPTSLIHHRDFVRLWCGDTVSQFGTQITLLAAPLLAVTVLHASPFQVGLLTTFETLAFLVVGLPAGAWVDRMRRRNVMIVADLCRGVALGSVPLTAYLGVLTIAQLYAVVLVNGVFTVFFDVAYQSYLPFLVGREHLVEGNAKLQASQSVSMVAGPSVGGLLVQLLTPATALLADAASFLWSALWVGLIRHREPRPTRAPDAHLGREIKEGVAFVVRDPLLRAIAATTGSSNLFSAMSGAMMIVLLARILHESAGVIGVLFSIGAVGGLLGALLARRIADRYGQGPTIWKSVAVSGVFCLLFPLAGHGWLLALPAISFFVTFAGSTVYNITQVSFRQGLCPDRLLGRMNASMRFIVWGTMPVGGLIGGVLGSTIGVRETVWVAAVASLFVFLPAYLSPLRRMRELPTGYDAEPDAPTRVDAAPDAGAEPELESVDGEA